MTQFTNIEIDVDNGGCDMRKPELLLQPHVLEEENQIMLDKIRLNYKKYDLLKKLESNQISIMEKMKRIEEYKKETFQEPNPFIFNLSAGGLFKDFDFSEEPGFFYNPSC